MKKCGNKQGLKMATDADWAGMYTVTGEKRSRTGSYASYDGMPVAWKSAFQQCKGSEFKVHTPGPGDTEEEAEVPIYSTSSGEAEVHAAADTGKLGMHILFMGEEINIPMVRPVKIDIDAGAALGFIQNTGTVGRMKHIDLRSTWVTSMRDRNILEFVKIPGDENIADFFTKIITGPKFKKFQDEMMKEMTE